MGLAALKPAKMIAEIGVLDIMADFIMIAGNPQKNCEGDKIIEDGDSVKKIPKWINGLSMENERYKILATQGDVQTYMKHTGGASLHCHIGDCEGLNQSFNKRY